MEHHRLVKLMMTAIITPLVAFYAPIQALLTPILWLVLFDILTGIYATRVVEKKALTSRGFLQKLPQLAMFLVALAAALHADPFFVTFGIDALQASKLVLSFYGIYELFSILENLGRCGLPVATQLHKLLQAKLPETMKDVIKDDKP